MRLAETKPVAGFQLLIRQIMAAIDSRWRWIAAPPAKVLGDRVIAMPGKGLAAQNSL